jgi:3-dehydroquinate synthase
MSELTVIQGSKSTLVRVEAGLLSGIGTLIRRLLVRDSGSSCAVVSDRTVARLFGQLVRRSLAEAELAAHFFEIEPGEASKSLGAAAKVYDFLAAAGVGRDGVVMALGGGVVGDLAGFAAGTWMRGIPLVICPTTMEADVDASIGGKTAVNTAAGKNLVGVFHPPVLVAIDPNCLATLAARDVRAGLAESVKHAVVVSPEFLAWHETRLDEVVRLEPAALSELIERNIRIKSDVVSRDPEERSGERMLLNFGHTIGHAIEARAEFSLRHGECVGLGMVAACRLSQRLGLLDAAVVDRVTDLLARVGLPTRLEHAIPADRIIETIGSDKKRRGGKVRYVLLEGIGRPVIRDAVAPALVREVYESLLV